jgi:purine-nucleoside phosphorylase
MDTDYGVEEARRFLAPAAPFPVRTGIILGSGLGVVRRAFRAVRAFPYGEIPGFPVSTVRGHRGEVVFAQRAKARVVILDGRVHCYEGYSRDQVTFPARVLHALGVKTIIVTNASGAVSGKVRPGDIMLLEDHIDLIWTGVTDLGRGPLVARRPYYSKRLGQIALGVGLARGIPVKQGVLLASTGPAYETLAEVEFARKMGVDAVTMSTVPEVTVCRRLGISVLGLSLVTNVAASHSGGHEKVIDFAARASRSLRALILGVLEVTEARGGSWRSA